MSILYPNALPEAVCINGTDYRIRPQFYIILEIIQILNGARDQGLTPAERMALALELFYRDAPPDATTAIQAMQEFTAKGSWDNGYTGRRTGDTEQILDWDIDAPFIWASLKQAYPFWDWSQAHWWEFKAAFDSLPASSKIKEVMRIRAQKIDSKMDREQQEELRELKRAYSLEKRAAPKRRAKDIEAELKARARGEINGS